MFVSLRYSLPSVMESTTEEHVYRRTALHALLLFLSHRYTNQQPARQPPKGVQRSTRPQGCLDSAPLEDLETTNVQPPSLHGQPKLVLQKCPVVGSWVLLLTNRPLTPVWILAALGCLLYTSPSPRDRTRSRMPSSA